MNINKIKKRTRDKSYLFKYMKLIFIFLLFGSSFLWARPSVTITVDSNNPTNNPLATVTFTFDEEVTGFTADDVELTGATYDPNQNSFMELTSFNHNKRWRMTFNMTTEGTVKVEVGPNKASSATGGNYGNYIYI